MQPLGLPDIASDGTPLARMLPKVVELDRIVEVGTGRHGSSISSAGGGTHPHRQKLPLPRPATLNLKHQCPAQEGANHDQSGKEAEAGKGHLDRNRLGDVGGDQDFEAKQQRSADVNLVSIVQSLVDAPTCGMIGRPDNAGDNNEDAEKFDAGPDEPNYVAYGTFEAFDIDVHHYGPFG